MEEGYGGPVWHASAVAATEDAAWALAEQALAGVGDAAVGEWRERGKAMHLRRRLTSQEAERVGKVRDIRGTPEEARRMKALLTDAPYLRALLR